jgi:hypothetical protein
MFRDKVLKERPRIKNASYISSVPSKENLRQKIWLSWLVVKRRVEPHLDQQAAFR